VSWMARLGGTMRCGVNLVTVLVIEFVRTI